MTRRKMARADSKRTVAEIDAEERSSMELLSRYLTSRSPYSDLERKAKSASKTIGRGTKRMREQTRERNATLEALRRGEMTKDEALRLLKG